MSDFQDVKADGFAPFQNNAAFNTYWTYNPSTKQAFWAQLSSRYTYFGMRYLQHWLYWYDGWVPYFHNSENGIFSTKLAQSLVNRVADKVYGGRLMFKNAGAEQCKCEPNEALKSVSKWAEHNFCEAFHRAITYAGAGGTALIKANRDRKGLWTEALRVDSFIPTVDFRGNVIRVECFLTQYADLRQSEDGKRAENYYLVEERYFGDIETEHVLLRNKPLVCYSIKKACGVVGAGGDVTGVTTETVPFKRLPKDVRRALLKNYNTLTFDTPQLLPFNDWLGVELVKWTPCVSDLPMLPFGESLLAPIVAQLMAYDYYFSAFATDMYTGRAKVLMPGNMIDPVKASNQQNYNANFDSFLYKKYPTRNPENDKPIPLQFDLRATDWKTIRDTLLENIAVSLGVNTSTIAGFLGDNNARTAREISTEENETAGYINTKRNILGAAANRYLKHITEYMGFPDTVEVRWSRAGLTNMQSLAEILNIGMQAGFISKRKAVEMFNLDDDVMQVEEEYNAIKADDAEQQSNEYAGFGAFGDEERLPK